MEEVKIIRYLLPLLNLYPWAIPAIITLGILSSFSEGLGLSLFIPLLQGLDQAAHHSENSSGLVGSLNHLFTDISSPQRFFVILLSIFAAISLKNGISYGNTLLFSWLNAQISHRLRSQIFNQLLRVSYRFLETDESGRLINVLATETWQTSRALAVLVGLITSLCTIFVYVILLLLISWQLTLVVSVAVTLISLLIQKTTQQVKHLGQQAVQANTVLANRMWEGMGGMKVIRAFGRESYEQERFDQSSETVQKVFLKLDFLAAIVSPLSELLSAGLVLCILAVAVRQNQSALPALLTFLLILYRLQPQVKQLDAVRVSLSGLTASVEAVMSLINSSDKPYILSGTLPFRNLQQSIAYESVTFYYNPSEKPALQNVSIRIPRGKTTALVGPSGAGKSTLINLLYRLYEVTQGEIYVDGLPLRQLNLEDWRNRIALVSQDVYLFSATVRDNIAYGRLEATEAEILAAAKLANADEFISQLPQGYDTEVGNGGIRLSGGQRQRIALARAIVRNPDILILDEATNALDSISENLIQESLSSLSYDRTIIVIAHRLSTIEQADQIIVLEQGQVVEQGTLQQLLSLDGLFAKLYRLQYNNVQT